jgi:predicted transcriptional regulator
MALADDIVALVARQSSLTEREIAQELFANPYQQRVNSTCRRLIKEGLVKRKGRGGIGDPYRYTL